MPPLGTIGTQAWSGRSHSLCFSAAPPSSRWRRLRKAHPALLVEGLAELAARCEAHGHPVVLDEPLEGYDHVYVADPFGNRIELIEPLG